MLHKDNNCLSCAHRLLLREGLCPTEFSMDRAQEEGGIMMWESWTAPAHSMKFWRQNQCERRSLWQSKCILLKVIPPVYRTKEQNCFSVVLLLTVPALLWPSLNPPHNIQNQSSPVSLTFSCFSASISAVFLAASLTHAELNHLVLMAWYFTHMPPPWKIPWATWFTIYSNLAMCLFFCVAAPTDVNPLFHKGSQLPFSLKARWLRHLPVSETFNPT